MVPPNRNLPAPVTVATPAPNWPKDPDVAKRKANKNDDKPVIQQYDRAAEADRALRPDELNNVSQDPRIVAAPGTPEQSEPVNKPKKSIFSLDTLQEGTIRDFHRRAAALNLDRSAAGLSHAVAGSALWHLAGEQALRAEDARRAHGADALTHDPEKWDHA